MLLERDGLCCSVFFLVVIVGVNENLSEIGWFEGNGRNIFLLIFLLIEVGDFGRRIIFLSDWLTFLVAFGENLHHDILFELLFLLLLFLLATLVFLHKVSDFGLKLLFPFSI